MKNLLTLSLAFALPLAVACKPAEEAAVAPSETIEAAPVEPEPAPAPAAVTVGREMGADGMVMAHTGPFAAGDTVYVSWMTGDTAPGTAVKVAWMGPGEANIGEESKTVEAGMTSVTFQADTTGWAAGDYRAEVWVADQMASSQTFTVGEAMAAPAAPTQ